MSTHSAPLRIGVLGAANIARAFIAAVAKSSLVKVSAVASRDSAKAKAFAAECGVGRALGSYEALLADPAIDAIYNPLPNGLHAEWSIKAAAAKKHVLCEKPLAATGAEARAMFEAARANGVHLVEAYPYLAQPQTLEIRRLANSGTLGKLHLIRAGFGFPTPTTGNIRLDAALAGGSLMDAGSYPISFVRVVSGERPSKVHAIARWGQTDVDLTIAATLEHPSGLIAQVTSSMQTAFHRHAQVVGDKGTVDTQYLNHPPMGGVAVNWVRLKPTGADPYESVPVAEGNGFLAEAESFAHLVAAGPAQWTGATPTESIDIADTLEAILRAARSGAAVTLSG